MKNNLINFFIGILLLILGIQLNDNNKGASLQNENIAMYNNYCQNGTTITATIASVNQIKNVYSHLIIYTYNNKVFKQSITSKNRLNKTKLEISILKNDPNNYIIGNACEKLTYEVENKKSQFWEYFSILLILYGAFVILIKIIKIILKDNYKNLSAFQKIQNKIIPKSVKKILEFQLEKNKKIEFEVPNHGTFEIMNYNNKEDNFINPSFIAKEIEEHISRYLFPVINYSKVIPFATDCAYNVLFIESGKEEIILIDIDSSNSKPIVLKNKLENLIDINKLEFKNDKYYYNGLKKIEDIVTDKEYFYDIPDCIFEGEDYYTLFSKSFDLLQKQLDFSILSIETTEENYILNLNIENKLKIITVQRYSDYIDGDNFIKGLNEILLLLSNKEKKYYLITNMICDFGIVLADAKTYQTLSDNGCIEINIEKLNSDELAQIRKHSDLITEIDNIEFHLKVVKENNVLKKGFIYDFFYKTNYELDNNAINLLKQKLNINIKKTDSGYTIYFTM